MFSKILVPLDGSELAERAFRLAAMLAKVAGGELVLLRVPEAERVLSGIVARESRDVATSVAATYLTELHEAHAHLPVTIQTRVVNGGDVASVIVETAVSEQVDLMVMGANGRSGFGQAILGSVAERVLRNAPCPMLLARQERPIRKILVPLDGSHLSERALPLALASANTFAADVTLLRVEEDVKLAPQLAVRWLEREEGETEGIADRLLTDAATYLADIQAAVVPQKAARAPFAVETAVRHGTVITSLVDFIEEQAIDLVVMATHGFAGLARWDYGHVTEKILRGVDASLLIVRPAAHELM